MKGKTVIITGGGSGIGKAMATKFAKEGANVVITGRNADRLKNAKSEIETFEGQVLDFQMDVRIPENAEAMVKAAKEKFGELIFLSIMQLGTLYVLQRISLLMVGMLLSILT